MVKQIFILAVPSSSSALVKIIKPLLQKENVKFNHVWRSTIPFSYLSNSVVKLA